MGEEVGERGKSVGEEKIKRTHGGGEHAPRKLVVLHDR